MTQATPRARLIASPEAHDDLPKLIRERHALGLPAGALTIFGKQDVAIAAGLTLGGDRPPVADPGTPHQLAELVESGHHHEAKGGLLGASLGLLGGLVALALPDVGPLVFAGGAGLVLAEEALAGLVGMGLGGAIAAYTDHAHLASYEALFTRALAKGHWIVLVQGSPDELRRARAQLLHYPMAHLAEA